jgi:putative redox protein
MKAELRLDKNMRIIGTNEMGLETYFDTHAESGGDDSAATPMEVALQCMGACSFLDVISIVRKKKREVQDLQIHITAERATEHPRVITEAHLVFELFSPDAEMEDLQRAVDLSQEKYCGVSTMFKRGGCKVSWECKITRP